jgi:hypothetical protein
VSFVYLGITPLRAETRLSYASLSRHGTSQVSSVRFLGPAENVRLVSAARWFGRSGLWSSIWMVTAGDTM